MRTILALDLGTKTGWAIKTEIEEITSGSQSFHSKRHEGAGMRYLKFKRWLEQMIESNGITEVYYEEVRRHVGTDAAHVYGGLQSQLQVICVEKGIPFSSVPVGTIKKSATNKGNASKEQMVEAARQAGFDPKDDNQADAIHLLRYVLQPF